jgi:hypothetical protein
MLLAEPSPVAEWGLSADWRERLEGDPEIVTAIARARKRYPLPAGYTPRTIEIYFDDVISARFLNGALVYERRLPTGYRPPYIEYRLDGQMAFFTAGGQVLVDRLSKLTALDEILLNQSKTLLEEGDLQNE